MTTKEQERRALEQIRKIVESLGENSYIGTAFEGCFEIAEENIENDFACSMKQRREAAEAAEDSLREKVRDLESKIKILETSQSIARTEQEEAQRVNNILRDRAELAEQHMKLEAERANKGWAKAKAQEAEIIQLKAKLYDMMTR